MSEVLLTLLIIVVAAVGMGLGLLTGRGPVKTSCGAAACLGQGACEVCPRRSAAQEDKQT